MTHRIFTSKFFGVYPHYVTKAEKENRTKDEVGQIIRWLTGYDQAALEAHLASGTHFQTFFGQAPAVNPNAVLIKGVVCGVRVEDMDAATQAVHGVA